jgi:3-hydroxymyristoyl/3-hydroxydecanoyl-(acyl carrier protein) dehydratase
LLRKVKADKQNEIEASAYVPTDSPWFAGHFAGEPVLPAIAPIHMPNSQFSAIPKKEASKLSFQRSEE